MEARTRAFEAAVERFGAGRPSDGPVAIAAIQAGYRAPFYFGLFAEASAVVDQLASGPAAQALAESFESPSAGTAEDLRHWIAVSGATLDGATDPRPLAEVMVMAQSIGATPLFELSKDLSQQVESTHPLRRLPLPAVFARSAAGLDSIPGGGGEILVDEVRQRVARKKAQTEEWLGVQEEAHRQGMKTSVTMMYGLGESNADRIEHLFRVRELQARTGGFTAFICWPLQPEGTPGMSHYRKTDAVTYLRTLAIARIVLGNVPNIQSSWVTMGHKVGQVALRFGANDYGSLMMEENVVSAAGTTYRTTLGEIQRLITDAGFEAKRRRQDYSVIEEPVAA